MEEFPAFLKADYNMPQSLEEIREEMTKKLGYPPVYDFQVGAAVAINAGPRVVGVVFETKAKLLKKGK